MQSETEGFASLAGVLQRLRDSSDAGEQRFEQMLIGAVGFTPALQQIDLQQTDRVGIRVAQPYRTLQCRVIIQQVLGTFDPQEQCRPCDRMPR